MQYGLEGLELSKLLIMFMTLDYQIAESHRYTRDTPGTRIAGDIQETRCI